MEVNKYNYQVSWSDADQEFAATANEFPSLSWLDPNEQAAKTGFLNLVSEVVEDMKESGEKIPEPH
ncbi:antitoxin HicB [Corynebacterium sp.]|uniref:antitoxin HicB n=1 Tax=Corynebacterium sp. TaxID=1720 RepID=UPI0028A8EC42|nr:antitoxin HicB [Corynebacterium sp.]